MAKCISDKEVASKIYKELLKPSNMWANNPFKTDKWPENYLNKENKSMKNKHIKKCSTSVIIKEVQIKITIWYHYTPIKMPENFYKLTIAIASKYAEKSELSVIVSENAKLFSHFGRHFSSFLTKLNTVLPMIQPPFS